MKILHTAAAVLLGLAAPCAIHAAPLCPSTFGYATAGCDLIITVTDGGTTIALGPSSTLAGGTYDGNDDTLIGIVNNSSTVLSKIALSSNTDAFGFDGDGIDAAPYNAPGNASDTSGYGGPDAFFTGINAAQSAGIVNFLVPLAANGGTTYFSLEEALTPTTLTPTSTTPEPSTLVLLGTGLAGIAGVVRRRFVP